MNQTVSIIIPIYNEEENLCRCVDSVIGQSYKNLEVILINDGSTDKTPDICDSYARVDSRIRVIHQANQGLSAARNVGIDASTSDYIQFVDSDDYILPMMTEELITALIEEDASAAQCRFYSRSEVYSLSYSDENSLTAVRKIYNGDEVFLLLANDNVNTTVQWNKIFRREIFNNLRYHVGKFHEDEFIIHRELAKMSRIVCIDKRLYCYMHNPNSITSLKTAEKAIHACEAYLDRVSFFAENNNVQHAGVAYRRLLQLINAHRNWLNEKENTQMALDRLDQIQTEANRISNDCFPWESL